MRAVIQVYKESLELVSRINPLPLHHFDQRRVHIIDQVLP